MFGVEIARLRSSRVPAKSEKQYERGSSKLFLSLFGRWDIYHGMKVEVLLSEGHCYPFHKIY